MKINGKTWVVTGAGSGMGRELTLQILSKGGRVAMVDINLEGMEESGLLATGAQSRYSIHHISITDQEAVLRLPEQVIAAHGQVDGLFNNAGIIQPFVKIKDLDIPAINRVMDINFNGMMYMVKAFLAVLLARPEAHIVNTSSMGGFLPVPGQSAYGASKAAVKLFTEGLHSECKGTAVHVTTIFPGAVATNIAKNSGVETPQTTDPKESQMKMLSADKAVEIILKGVERNKYRVLVGKDAKMMDRLYRLMPERAAGIIANRMKELLAE